MSRKGSYQDLETSFVKKKKTYEMSWQSERTVKIINEADFRFLQEKEHLLENCRKVGMTGMMNR